MVKVKLNKKKFSSDGAFVLYDWRDSKEGFDFHDRDTKIYFFIKNLYPQKILEEIFINQIRDFNFNKGLESKDIYKGNVSKTVFKYIFASYELPRVPEFNWTRLNFPIRRDTNLHALEEETNIMKYLSKYIDN